MSSSSVPKSGSLVVVMPAYRAAATLEAVVGGLDPQVVDQLIIVDDASDDGTASCARALPERYPWLTGRLRVHALPVNRGYGGNQKECYRRALALGADCIVMLHPDGQYDPAQVEALAAPILAGTADLVLGNRIRSWRDARAGGMPRYKYVANRTLTLLQNLATGYRLPEWHSGFRAFSCELLRQLPYDAFRDDFVFDAQLLLAATSKNARLSWIESPVRYGPAASSLSFRGSVRYGVGTLWALLGTVRAGRRQTGILRAMTERRGFTLIELLVVISIIALLSTVVLASLNASRARAADSAIRANMRSISNQATATFNGQSYGVTAWTVNATTFPVGSGSGVGTPVFNDATVGAMMVEIIRQAGSVSYGSNGSRFVVVAPLRGGGYWCVDSGPFPGGMSTYQPPTVGSQYGINFECF